MLQLAMVMVRKGLSHMEQALRLLRLPLCLMVFMMVVVLRALVHVHAEEM